MICAARRPPASTG